MAKLRRLKLGFKERILRRILHMVFGAVVFYYFFPKMIFGIPAWFYLIFLLSLPSVVIEVWRIRNKRIYFGLHDHEKYHLASYFWLVNGAVLLLILFPQYIAAPCILAAAVGDPVIGETRPFRRRLAFSIGILICFLMFILFRYPIILAIIASIAAFIAESMNIQVSWKLRDQLFYSRSKGKVSRYKKLFDFIFKADDDLMMQFVPALIIYISVLIFQSNGWTWLIPPNNLIAPLKGLMPYV